MIKLVTTLLTVSVMSMHLFAADGYQMSVNSTDKTKLNYGGKPLFLSGMNIAWFKFSQDVGRQGATGALLYVDESLVRKSFQDLRKAGGNSVRWWLYTNNAMDPIIDKTTNLTTGIEASTPANVKKVLDVAAEYGILVDICFLSFDMLKGASYTPNVAEGWSRYNYDANHKMLTDTLATRAFIDKAVLPLVKEFKNHPGLLCWEVFNEPEGMTSTDNFGSGWGTTLIDISHIQRFINMVADAIHKEAPANLVSNGSAKTTMTSDVAGTNYYTDAKLLAAGGNNYPLGKLDFYMVHYYPEWNSNTQSPLHNPASFWQVDKPLVIGEFPAGDWMGANINSNATAGEDRRLTVDSAYSYAFSKGYAGALAWTLMPEKTSAFYNTTWCLDSTVTALKALYTAFPEQIKIKDVTFEDNTGKNGWMKVTYTNAAADAQLGFSKPFDLTGATSVSMKVANTATAAVSYMFVLQTGASDNWGWYQSSTKATVAAGKTATCTFKMSDIALWNDATATIATRLSQINAVYLVATTAFNGVVYIDSIITDNGILIHNFDKQYDVFSPAGKEAANVSSTTAYNDPTPVVRHRGESSSPVSAITMVRGALKLTLTANGHTTIDLYSVKGEHVQSLYNGRMESGTHTFAINSIAQGMYLVRARSTAGVQTGHILVK